MTVEGVQTDGTTGGVGMGVAIGFLSVLGDETLHVLLGAPLLSTNIGGVRCYRCRQEKPPDEMVADKRATERGWTVGECKKCKAERSRGSVTPEMRRATALAGRYGLTIGEYDALLKRQKGRCAICRRPPKKRRLYVDHDHATKKIRGLLCASCNSSLEWMLIRGDRARQYLLAD